LTLVDL